jgi:hypothetical protein
MLAVVVLHGVAVAQGGAQAAPGANPVRGGVGAVNVGALVQGGFGVTEDRNGFGFLMAGARAGWVLTPTVGEGMLRGNFEYGVEVFPLWQSYTPTQVRQSCVYVAGSNDMKVSCSVPFTVGGTFTGVSITPIVLRWNFAGSGRLTPWIQVAGGVLWTNHKYPAFGGQPVNGGGESMGSIGDNGPNDDTSVWNFTPQFGVGAHWFTGAKRSLDFGANAVHISSASLGDKNPGINASVQFTVGYSWWR